MDYEELKLSPLEFAEKREGRPLYPAGSACLPDSFTGLVLEALTMEFGSVSAFCKEHQINRAALLLWLTPQGADALPPPVVNLLCDSLRLVPSSFRVRLFDPVDADDFHA